MQTNILSSIGHAFSWGKTEEGFAYWTHATINFNALNPYNKTGVCEMNEVEEIVVPEYKEGKWMEGARLEYMIKARDGIKTGFDWSKTKQGFDYWKEVYTKLYIMCKHMEIYAVFKRLKGG